MRILGPLGHYCLFPLAVQHDNHLKQALANFLCKGPDGCFSVGAISATNIQLVIVVEKEPMSIHKGMGMTVFH